MFIITRYLVMSAAADVKVEIEVQSVVVVVSKLAMALIVYCC